MKKWWIGVMVVLVVPIFFTACTTKGKTTGTADTPQISQEEKKEDAQKAPTVEEKKEEQSQAQPEKAADTNVDKVLWEESGIKITYKGMEEDYMGVKLKVLVENNSSEDYNISLENMDVNGFSINDLFYKSVNAGKKANEEIRILSSYLESNGIKDMKEIKDIELIFEALGKKSMNKKTSPAISLKF